MARKPRQGQPVPPRKRTVEIPDSSYQPSKAELEEPVRIEGTFNDLMRALTAPVELKRVKRPK